MCDTYTPHSFQQSLCRVFRVQNTSRFLFLRLFRSVRLGRKLGMCVLSFLWLEPPFCRRALHQINDAIEQFRPSSVGIHCTCHHHFYMLLYKVFSLLFSRSLSKTALYLKYSAFSNPSQSHVRNLPALKAVRIIAEHRIQISIVFQLVWVIDRIAPHLIASIMELSNMSFCYPTKVKMTTERTDLLH